MGKYKQQGWFFQSHRHSLAAKGIKSKTIDFYVRGNLKIPITERKRPKSHIYPVTVKDVKKSLDKIPEKELVGLKEISFRPPSRLPFTEQSSAWAQYADKADRLNIYSEPVKVTVRKGMRYKKMPEQFDEYHEGNDFMTSFVIPHEIGHHHALDHMKKRGDSQLTADARADALALGQNPNDKSIVGFFAKRRLQSPTANYTFAKKPKEIVVYGDAEKVIQKELKRPLTYEQVMKNYEILDNREKEHRLLRAKQKQNRVANKLFMRKQEFVKHDDIVWKKGNIVGFEKDRKLETGMIKNPKDNWWGYEVETG